jgi:2-C-methyl-D-erythritol 4-phosphate cytidylyltransferase/2-C-methyl-D-erythritol 2,4-cyclodiphosphate synthase
VTGAVLLAAGSGSRMGGENKLLRPLAGKCALLRCLEALEGCPEVDKIAVVAGAEILKADLTSYGKVTAVVPGGSTRGASALAGLEALKGCQIVLLHDAARPLAGSGLFTRAVRECVLYGSAVAASRVADTLVRLPEGTHVSREGLWAVQTPQCFPYAALLEAYRLERERGFAATDDAGVYAAAGYSVHYFEAGENRKLTYPGDEGMISTLLYAREPRPQRVGFGFDAHRLIPDRRLVLCGVEVPFPLGLRGHSDADVAVHALMDALLGAAALGDIGQHFPDSDPAYAGADSLALLGKTLALLRAAGWQPFSADVTLICQRPKISPYREEMAEKLAAALGLPVSAVSVKATTTEGMGFTGREEGIAAQVVATLSPLHPTEP